jgi:DNA-binding transcriptional regulator YiaG
LPQQRGFIETPTTVGEHIRKKRMELGLFQSDVAKMFKVSEDCITYWENNRSEPQVSYYPSIIEFLGYLPLEFDMSSLIGKIKAYRYRNGLSQKRFAKVFGIDTGTFRLWENENRRPSIRMIKKLEVLLTTKPLI